MKNIYKLMIAVVFAATLYFIFDSVNTRSYFSKELYSYQLQLQDKHKNLSYLEILKLPKTDRPDLAALQHFEMTKDPSLGFPPIERKVDAYEKILANYKKSTIGKTASADVEWVERGPNNVGGRTRALMFDPNDATNKKVWAGSISGGLWVNQDITDASVGWTNINDFMASLSIASLTYDPNNKHTFYLGTGEIYTHDFAGLGIWKSVDEGDSWTHLTNTSNFSYVPKMLVTNNSTIISATERGIKRSTDGGDTWGSPPTATMSMSDVELASNGDLYAGDFLGYVHKSTDDGVTWSSMKPASGGERVEITISATNSSVIYAVAAIGGTVAWLSKSVDGGANWIDKTIPKYSKYSTNEDDIDFARNQAGYNLIMGVHPTDENKVFLGGIDLHRSTDGGTTWKHVSDWMSNPGEPSYVHADQHAFVFRPQNPNQAISGSDGGVYYSSDIGYATEPSFIARNKNYNVTQFYSAATVNELLSNEFLAGAQDNGTQRFLDAGINATKKATGGDGAFCHIDQDDPNYQITSYVFSTYYLSSNHGNSFGFLNDDGGNRTGRFINPTEYDSDANILYGAANHDQIERIANITSSPSGIEIFDIDLGGYRISTIKASPYTDNRLFVGVQGVEQNLIFRIDNADGNLTVTNISGNLNASFDNWVSSIDVGASDDQLLVTFSNYGVQSIFESTNAGANWNTKEGNLGDFPVYDGLYNPFDRNQVLIATELGVWSTEDITASSPNWVVTNIDLANVSTRMLKFRDSDGLLVAATYGRGLFTTSSFNTSSFAIMVLEDKISYTGTEVAFTSKSFGTVSNLLWSFGDGYTSTDTNPTHTFALPGTYSVTLQINNGQSIDQKLITIFPSKSIPYLAADGGDFENNTDDFYIENISGTQFERGNSDVSGKEGTTSGDNAWVTGLTEPAYADKSLAYIYSPGYDFSAAGSYSLSFQTNYSFEPTWDGFIVEYSIDKGKTWLKLGDAVESGWYNQISDRVAIWGIEVPVFSGSTIGFEKKSKDVSFLAGNTKVGFRIHFGTDVSTTNVGMALDDFEINGPSSTPIPNFLSSNPKICEGGVVIYNDNSTGTISNYAWSFGSGASPASATGSGPHEVTYAAGGQYSTALTVTGFGGDVVNTKVNYADVVACTIIDNQIDFSPAEFTACNNLEGIITVKNSNINVRYQAFDENNNAPLGQYKTGNGNDIDLNIGKLTKTVTAYVKATAIVGVFTLPSLTFSAIGPHDKTVTNDYLAPICSGEVVTFTIGNSDVDVIYRIENSANNSEISSIVGNGSTISLETGEIENALSVTLKGALSTGSCTIVLGNQLDIEVKPLPNVIIVQTGSVMAVQPGEQSYQWFFEGELIEGATEFSYTPFKSGNYTCEVISNFECSATSSIFNTLVMELNDQYFGNSVFIYPNPTSENMFLDVSNEFKGEVGIKIYNLNGTLLFSSLENKQTLGFLKEINVSNFNCGIYFVQLQFGDKREVRKITIN